MSAFKRNRSIHLLSTILAGAIAPCWAMTAQAAEAPVSDDALPEITVTAERRAESSQKVPLAIQSIDGETLAKTGYTSVTDLQYTMPGVQFDPTQGAAFQIRASAAPLSTSRTPSRSAWSWTTWSWTASVPTALPGWSISTGWTC
ncbi:hypothetical protein [Novosphingobium sp. ST904]|uniref:hypothetical protein n=1 Tax=Novosphingobium sp. ST904 TaxID=1684385 RepID=UPI000A4ECBB8|nr:hypothetical protein [Novosphingobium sp. ST904]